MALEAGYYIVRSRLIRLACLLRIGFNGLMRPVELANLKRNILGIILFLKIHISFVH